jgi:hypothetical protein
VRTNRHEDAKDRENMKNKLARNILIINYIPMLTSIVHIISTWITSQTTRRVSQGGDVVITTKIGNKHSIHAGSVSISREFIIRQTTGWVRPVIKRS